MARDQSPPSQFFVPGVEAASAESVYASLANLCGAAVPEPKERLESIIFRHDGEVWTATVGRQLAGERARRVRRKGELVDVTDLLSDRATVLAIFPTIGGHHRVATDGTPSAWSNPIMVGNRAVLSLRRFASA